MTTSQPTAITRVLNTYKVLQVIISFLPSGMILTNQLVYKYWQSVIKTSPEIRKRLLLMPNGPTISPLHVTSHVAQSLIKYTEYLQINPMCSTQNIGHKIGPEVSNAQSLSLRAHMKRLRLGKLKDIHNEKDLDGIQYTMFITQPPCTTIALIVNGLKVKEDICFQSTEHYNWCTVRDTAGIKLDLVLKTALRMAQTLETPEDVEMFCGVVSFWAPLTDVEKAVWEDKTKRVERHSEMVRENGGIAKGTRRNDIEALWKARTGEDAEAKLKEEPVEVASDASE